MELKLERYTLPHFFAAIIEKFSHKKSLALVGEEPFTYEELGKKVVTLRNFLSEKEIKKRQKVLLLGDNSPNWGIAYFAITTLGAIAVPVLSEFPESDINHIIRHSDATAAFIDEKIYSSMDLTALDSMPLIISLNSFFNLKETTPKEEHIWNKLQNIPDKIQDSFKRGIKMKILGKRNVAEEDDLAEILYTSGTTGHSKGVMLTHKNIVTNALVGPEALGGVPEDSVILNLLPLAHAYGCTTAFLGGLSCGASLYFLARKPSPKILMEAMQKVRPTIVTGVPLIFEKIYHKRVIPQLRQRKTLKWISKINLGRKLLYRKIGKMVLESFGGKLYSFVIGGASLNHEVEVFLREGGIPFAIGYGLSECSPVVAGDYFPHLKYGSVGRVVAGVTVKIDNPAPGSNVGEVLVKGPNVMKGYYKNSEQTKKVFTKEGWLRTGDLGILDSKGYLFIKGRSKNVYVGPSGENIYPEMIEDKLRESVYVEETLVYVDRDRLIARVYLDYDYIQTVLDSPKHTIHHKEIEKILESVRKETNAKLPSYSQIKNIYEQPEPFEKTPTNKIKRALYVPDYLEK